MSAGEPRPIILMGEEMPACPMCGARLSVSDNPVASDGDGPIYAGVCAVHGTWRLQDDPEGDSEEDEDGDRDESDDG